LIKISEDRNRGENQVKFLPVPDKNERDDQRVDEKEHAQNREYNGTGEDIFKAHISYP
jgi:hypothetical protein